MMKIQGSLPVLLILGDVESSQPQPVRSKLGGKVCSYSVPGRTNHEVKRKTNNMLTQFHQHR